MALGEWKITLRIDFDDPKKADKMTKLAMSIAKEFLTSAMLMQDRRKPDIALEYGDMFAGRDTIELVEQEDYEEPTDGAS
jgi:hypothetical protein